MEPIGGARDWSAVRLTLVTSEIKRRARRLGYLRPELLSEPAWDILLHAYSLKLTRREVTVATLIDQVHAPSSTVFRWLKVLEVEGLLTRAVAPPDPERVAVKLTQKGVEAMESYFSVSP